MIQAFNETISKQKCKEEGQCTDEELAAEFETLRHIYDEEVHYQMNSRWNFTILLQERISSSKHRKITIISYLSWVELSGT